MAAAKAGAALPALPRGGRRCRHAASTAPAHRSAALRTDATMPGRPSTSVLRASIVSWLRPSSSVVLSSVQAASDRRTWPRRATGRLACGATPSQRARSPARAAWKSKRNAVSRVDSARARVPSSLQPGLRQRQVQFERQHAFAQHVGHGATAEPQPGALALQRAARVAAQALAATHREVQRVERDGDATCARGAAEAQPRSRHRQRKLEVAAPAKPAFRRGHPCAGRGARPCLRRRPQRPGPAPGRRARRCRVELKRKRRHRRRRVELQAAGERHAGDRRAHRDAQAPRVGTPRKARIADVDAQPEPPLDLQVDLDVERSEIAQGQRLPHRRVTLELPGPGPAAAPPGAGAGRARRRSGRR